MFWYVMHNFHAGMTDFFLNISVIYSINTSLIYLLSVAPGNIYVFVFKFLKLILKLVSHQNNRLIQFNNSCFRHFKILKQLINYLF